MAFLRGIKEFFRKFMVSLKRRPHNIPLVLLVVSFFQYSLNTSCISDTTAILQGPNMGLAGFVTMLVSILIFVIFLNAFPKRQKPKLIMLILLYAMFVILIIADVYYGNTVIKMLSRSKILSPARDLAAENPYIYKAITVVFTNAILVVVNAILVALLPVYGALLKKVNTSVSVEDNGQLGEIEISEE